MGIQLSHIHEVQDSCQEKPSRVKALHTKDQWKNQFNACKNSDKLLVIDFTATWCGPCRFMEPILNEFVDKYSDVEFVKVDVDELPDVATEYGVQAMPTFLLLKRGNQVDRVVGASKDDLQEKIEKHRK
ncbi:thioredoxin H2 [Ziziphus jujuba]|nr:thioredoxin H2 [Ziziphus jujuba]